MQFQSTSQTSAILRLPANGPGTTAATVTATTQIALSTGVKQKKVRLLRCRLKHIAGDAVSFVPRIYSLSGALAQAIEQEFQGVSTLVANLFDPQMPDSAISFTDATGNIYLEPGPNAGANNQFQYLVVIEVLP